MKFKGKEPVLECVVCDGNIDSENEFILNHSSQKESILTMKLVIMNANTKLRKTERNAGLQK